MIDSHCHITHGAFDLDRDLVIQNSKRELRAIITCASSLDELKFALKLSEKYPKFIHVTAGIHPVDAAEMSNEEFEEFLSFIELNKDKIVGIGEVGLDYKYERIWDKQLRVFNEMLHMAEKLDLPVIIHSRGTTAQIVEMLPSFNLKKVLLHWFSNPISVLPKVVENGYYITEGPPTAYSNGIREVVKRIPLANLLTETDGPVRYWKNPFKGKRTTPAFIPTVV
ncbi:MAG: TatD family hydrolase, partial [Candidatus Bathyarchaeia archaeon]